MSKIFFLLIIINISINTISVAHSQQPIEIIQEIKKGRLSSIELQKWSQEKDKEDLCFFLSELQDRDLIYFETLDFKTSCLQVLKQRIIHFQKKLEKEFINSYQEKSKNLIELKPAPPLDDGVDLGLVDTDLSPVLVKADLPPGFVALTFDDGPHPVITKKIFESLERLSQNATFFPTGVNARKYPLFIDELRRLGHTYGSHTMTHPDLRKLSFQEAKSEIIDALDLLTRMTGQEMRFFRFPYGATTPQLNRFLKDQRIASFFWNIDSEDWRHRDPIKAYNQVITQLNSKRSGIILFHDIVSATAATVEVLLQELENKGYKVILLRPKFFR